MGELRVNDVSIYHEEQGAGVPILCIHGTGSSAAAWEAGVKELSRLGRVISYDRRGCSRSERPRDYVRTSVVEHSDDAAALLAALDASPAVVIGRSYGGEVAVDMVMRHRDAVRALVLLEPAILSLSTETSAWHADLTSQVVAIEEADGAEVAAEYFYRVVIGDDTWESLPAPYQDMVRANGPAIVAELRGAWLELSADDLASVKAPVLIVSGDSSPSAFRLVDDELTSMIPGARHEVVQGGHMVDPAAPVVLDFLEEVLRDTPT